MENLTGRTFGQYKLEALLGLGGMGTVYRGYQSVLQREVAVKVLDTSLANDDSYAERFMREARTAATLEHAHIVPIYDYGTDGLYSFVVMRLLTGGTLTERITYCNEHDLPLPSLTETVEVTRQLASALAYAHRQGVIHRDIKNSNIMFDQHGTAFLVDFGIARLISVQKTELTGTGAVMGTPWYMAPEQWRGEDITPAVDQYALAVTVYSMLTGQMPFHGDTPYQLLHQHLHEPPRPLTQYRDDLPTSIMPVLERALHKDPAWRFENIQAFADALAAAIESSNVPKQEATSFYTFPVPKKKIAAVSPTTGPQLLAPQSPAPPTRPRPPLIYIIMGGVIIVLLIAAGVLLLNRRNGPLSVVIAETVTSTPTTEPTNPPATEFIVPVADTSTPTATDTPSATATVTPSLTHTLTPTPTVTPSLTHTATATETPTTTITPSPTTTSTPTPTVTPTSTQTPTATVTSSPTNTLAPTATQTLTATIAPSLTSTPEALPSSTREPSPTATITVSLTHTLTPMPTVTPSPTATATVTLTPTQPTISTDACNRADLNNNHRIDFVDIQLLRSVYGKIEGDAEYRAEVDQDDNGVINILDLRHITRQFGEDCPPES